MDVGWDLKALEKDALLSLDADVLGPFDETGEVASWLDVTTDSEVLGALLEEALSSICKKISVWFEKCDKCEDKCTFFHSSELGLDSFYMNHKSLL